MRVLLFSNDLMPFENLPTSGGGLRSYQLYRALQGQGIDVQVSMPGFTFLVEKHKREIPPELQENFWEFGNQDELIRRIKPDAVLYSSNWFHVDLHLPLSVPLIVDLHGSWALETQMWRKPIDLDRKLRIFAKADCLLTAGERQRKYFYGWLVQAGRVPAEDFIRYIPVSVDPNLPQRRDDRVAEYPHFVSGGGWFPWQNQAPTLYSICQRVMNERRGKIEIFGSPHSADAASSEEREILEIYEKIKSFQQNSKHVLVSDYIGRDQLIERYRAADVAVEAMRYNLEREFAFTTRTIEYLGCGLPVLYNNFSEIASHIAEYQAGWTINPESESEIRSSLDTIFNDPNEVRRRSENAQRLVRDRFTWDKTIAPLMDFLRAPKIAERVEPAVGLITARTGFLTTHGEPTEIPFCKNSKNAEATFVMPADEIASVELQFGAAVGLSGGSPGAMAYRLSRVELPTWQNPIERLRGLEICRGEWEIPAAGDLGRQSIPISPLRGVSGGELMRLDLEYRASSAGENLLSSQSVTVVHGVLGATFPLVSGCARERGPNSCNIALSFVPGYDSAVYRLKVLSRRALEMARRGEWRRVTRALRRRVLWLGYKLREKFARGV